MFVPPADPNRIIYLYVCLAPYFVKAGLICADLGLSNANIISIQTGQKDIGQDPFIENNII